MPSYCKGSPMLTWSLLISSRGLVRRLKAMASGRAAILSVRMFCWALSERMWEDDCGVTHRVHQGEEEHGDILFSVGGCATVPWKALFVMVDVLERNAQISDPDAVVWRGSLVPSHFQGKKFWGGECVHRAGVFVDNPAFTICIVWLLLEFEQIVSDPMQSVWSGSCTPAYWASW